MKYVDNFSFEWLRHRRTQLDAGPGGESERTFRQKTGLGPEDVRGKLVLDAGCGMGRFAEVVSRWGAQVVAVDLSRAVEAARENLAGRDNVLICQADVRRLPFREGQFDFIYSIGVLHHTPDCEQAFRGLVRYLAPGGTIVIWLYEADGRFWERCSHFYRRLTVRMPPRLLHRLCYAAVPAYYLFRIPVIGRLLWTVLPMSQHPHPEWRVLDTFDWYSPRYQSKHTYPEVEGWFQSEGLTDIKRLQTPVAVSGIKQAHVQPLEPGGPQVMRRGRRHRWLRYGVALVMAAGVGVVMCPYLSLFGPRPLRDYVYRQVTYALIAHRVAASGTRSELDIATRLGAYVHNMVFSGAQYTGGSSFVLDNLVSGTGICYDQSLDLVVLAHYAGLEGRTRMLAQPVHSIAELRADGAWRYFDPWTGVMLMKAPTYDSMKAPPPDARTTLRDLIEGDVTGVASKKMRALAQYYPKELNQYLLSVSLGAWGPFSAKQGWLRLAINRVVRWSVRVLSPPVLAGYQDLYLSRYWAPDPRSEDFFNHHVLRDPAFQRFYRARNLHLWGRTREARAQYQRLLEGAEHGWRDDALYFLGQSYREDGELTLAIRTFERLLTDDPETFWNYAATYWLAWCYQQQGDVDRARMLYTRLAEIHVLDATVRLMELQHYHVGG